MHGSRLRRSYPIGQVVALFLSGVALSILAFSSVVFLAYSANLMQFSFDYDQGEGFELYDSVLFSQGEWPYRDTEVYPFYASNYPPLFHIFAVPFVWLFGPAYWYGRLLGALATLLTAGAIAYAVYRDGGRNRGVALFAGLAFLASNTVYHIGPLFRQHMTMVMLETVAVVVLASAFPAKRTRKVALGLGLLIAAGYTKQLAAITALATLVWLFLRNPRRGLWWGVGFVAVGGAIFLWMNAATNGEWWRQTIRANANVINPSQSIALFVLWFKLHGVLIIPAILYLLYELYRDRLSLYSVWFVFAVILGGASSGTWGGGDSYFATAISATCILSGLFAGRLYLFVTTERYRTVILMLIPLIYALYGRATLHLPTNGPFFGAVAEVLGIQPNVRDIFYDSASYDVVGYANIGYFLTEADEQAGYAIVERIRMVEGPVLSEEAGFSLVAGRDVITNPTQLLNLANAGLFDGGQLIRMIDERAFALVILRAQFYPQSVLQAIWRAYELDQTVAMNGFDYLILVPR